MKVEVDFEYSAPEWATVTVDNVKDKIEGGEVAHREFDALYPEAIDPVVLEVREIA